MATWDQGRPLRPDQYRQPVRWMRPLIDPHRVPRLGMLDFDRIFDTTPGAVANRLRTFGHVGGEKGEPGVPHWIATRGGTPMHHDPAYPRWSIQVAIFNVGLALMGLDGYPVVPPPGWAYLLDTHSPHQVKAVGSSTLTIRQKCQAAIDYVEEPEWNPEVAATLRDFIAAHHPTRGGT